MDVLQLFSNALKYMPMLHSIRNMISGTARLRLIQKTSIQYLPTEILLKIFSILELKAYILCHGVCKKWQQLLPSTHMDPIRRRLLDLYRGVSDTQDFEKTLEWTDQNLQPFDREEYVRCLLSQYPAIPEEFRMWILEWPARLVIHCIWPGLSFVRCQALSAIVRRPGINWLAYRSFSPQLSSMVYKYGTPSRTVIAGLFIWGFGHTTDWLIFGQDEPDLFGRVYLTNLQYHLPGTIPYYPPRQDNHDDDDDDDDTDSEYSEGEENVFFFDDWISYLEYFWNRTADSILHPQKIYLCPDPPIHRPLSQKFGGFADDNLPAPQWAHSQTRETY